MVLIDSCWELWDEMCGIDQSRRMDWQVFIHLVVVLLGRTSTLRSHSLKSFLSQPCGRYRIERRDVLPMDSGNKVICCAPRLVRHGTDDLHRAWTTSSFDGVYLPLIALGAVGALAARCHIIDSEVLVADALFLSQRETDCIVKTPKYATHYRNDCLNDSITTNLVTKSVAMLVIQPGALRR